MSLSGGNTSNDSNTASSGNALQTSRGTQVFSTGPTNADQIGQALGSAQQLYQAGNPTINAGIGNINAGATAAGGLFGAGNQELTNTLNGSYLDPASNPYLQATYDQAAGNVARGVRQEFSGDDASFGGAAHQAALGNALGNLATNIYGGNYAAERGNQTAAAGMLPSYTAGMLQPGQAQLAAGYQPINQYISALGSISPGTQGSVTKDVTAQTTSNSSGSGSANGSSMNYGLSLK